MKTLIRGGYVIDPADRIQAKLNLLIEDGKIASVTCDEPDAEEVIDAGGLTVAPGFIDMHMHEDPVVDGKIEYCIFDSMLRMGVTTVLAGNCGDNMYDPAGYLDIVDRDKAPVNIAMLAGHTWFRDHAGALDKYSPVTGEQLETMKTEISRELRAGLLGISFGIRYVPGTDENEFEEIASLCVPDDRLVAAHVRDDATNVFSATTEFLDIAKKFDLSAEVSHIGSMAGYGQMEELLRLVDAYRANGLRVMCDCYPYYAFSTQIGSTTFDDGWLERYNVDYSVAEMAQGKYKGMRLDKEMFDEMRRDLPDGYAICHVMKEEDVDMGILDPGVMIGSDGSLDNGQGHPRAAGAFPRLIAKYVRTGMISLYDAVDKMSAMAAKKMGLDNKGRLSVGADADIVIFDAETMEDKSTFADPLIPPVGISRVMIAGKTAVLDGEIVDGRLGRSVRK